MGAAGTVQKRNETPEERARRIAKKELEDARFNLARASRVLENAQANYDKALTALNRRRAAYEAVMD